MVDSYAVSPSHDDFAQEYREKEEILRPEVDMSEHTLSRAISKDGEAGRTNALVVHLLQTHITCQVIRTILYKEKRKCVCKVKA